MFVFSENLTFWWPVKPMEPDPENPGQHIEHSFEVLFEMPSPELVEFRRKTRIALLAPLIAKGVPDDEYAAAQTALETFDREVAEATVKDWRNIADANGKPLPFTLFASAYRHDRIRSAIVHAYDDAISQDRARLGN